MENQSIRDTDIDFSQKLDNNNQKEELNQKQQQRQLQKKENNSFENNEENFQNLKNDKHGPQGKSINSIDPNKNLQSMSDEQKRKWLAQQLLQYDADQKPFDLVLAQNHAKAQMIYKDEVKLDFNKVGNIQQNSCPCCNLPIEGEKIPFCSQSDQLAHLGPAYPLYFLFFRLSMIFLIIIFVFSGIPLIVYNLIEDQCQFYDLGDNIIKECSQAGFSYFSSIISENGEPHNVVNWMNLLTSIILMVYISYKLRGAIQKEEMKVDSKDISVSDYSLQVSHIPLDQTKKQIKEFFEGLGEQIKAHDQKQKQNIFQNLRLNSKKSLVDQDQQSDKQIDDEQYKIKVEKVVLSYNVTDYLKLKQRFEQLEIQILEHQQKVEQQQDRLKAKQKEMEKKKKTLQSIKVPPQQKESDNKNISLTQSQQKDKSSIFSVVSNLQVTPEKQKNEELSYSEEKFLNDDQTNDQKLQQKSIDQHGLQEIAPLDDSIYQEKDELKKQIKQYEIECINEEGNKSGSIQQNQHFTGCCFISFQTEKMAILVNNYFQYDFKQTYFSLLLPQPTEKLYNGNKLSVQYAPEPGAIMWENLGISTLSKIIRRLSTYIATIFIISICFLIQFYCSYGQVQIIENELGSNSDKEQQGQNTWVQIISIGISLITMITNNFLSIIIYKFSKIEAHSNQTAYQVSIIKKLSIAQFFNTALVPLIVEMIANNGNFYTDGGLISDISTIIVLDIFLTPIFNYIDIGYLIFNRLFQLYYIWKPEKRIKLSQKQANILFENQKLKPSARLSNILKTILVTCFYSYLIPNLSILCYISLLGQMYMEWYLILRRQSMPNPLGAYLIEEIMEYYIDFCVVVFSVSCYLFEYIFYQKQTTIALIQLILSILYWILPVDRFLMKLKLLKRYEDKHEEEEDYMTNKKNLQFTQDYDRSNPITQSYAIKDYLKFEIEHCTKAIDVKKQQFQGIRQKRSTMIMESQQKKEEFKQQLQVLQKQIENKDIIILDKQNSQTQNRWRKGVQKINILDYLDKFEKKKIIDTEKKNSLNQNVKKVMTAQKAIKLTKIVPRQPKQNTLEQQ